MASLSLNSGNTWPVGEGTAFPCERLLHWDAVVPGLSLVLQVPAVHTKHSSAFLPQPLRCSDKSSSNLPAAEGQVALPAVPTAHTELRRTAQKYAEKKLSTVNSDFTNTWQGPQNHFFLQQGSSRARPLASHLHPQFPHLPPSLFDRCPAPPCT